MSDVPACLLWRRVEEHVGDWGGGGGGGGGNNQPCKRPRKNSSFKEKTLSTGWMWGYTCVEVSVTIIPTG